MMFGCAVDVSVGMAWTDDAAVASSGSRACRVSSTPDHTTGEADTSTEAIASARPVRGLMREMTSHSTITNSVRLNLKATAPAGPSR